MCGNLPVRVYHWINAVAWWAVRHRLPDRRAGPPVLRGRGLPAVLVRLGAVHPLPVRVCLRLQLSGALYWGFVGNKYSTGSLLPAQAQAQRQEIVDVIKADVLETKLHGPISTGHNALAGLIYFFTFLAFVFQTITGFALYSSMSNSWLPRMFTWIVPLMGGEFGVRFWHHTFLWFFVTFIIIHIYLAFYHDYIEGRGTVSSIIGGWKFEREKSEK
jgi:Ni/Fe-hydrogenase 1 B-type cytochrome subunit